jgi:hypothetical protein
MQGALSDVLGELGFLDAIRAYHKWQDGQGTAQRDDHRYGESADQPGGNVRHADHQ